MADIVAGVRERLTAYLLPRRAESAAELAAFERAVAAQVEYEQRAGLGDVPEGVKSFSIGDFSATLGEGGQGAGYTRETLSPVAWSILKNAGLIGHAWPTARRA